MIADAWADIEPLIEELTALEGAARHAKLAALPQEIREQVETLLRDEAGFEPWAAEAAGRLVAAKPQLATPCTLGHYRVVRHLESGGMGEIYEGEDPRLRRKVAIKVLHAGAVRRLDEEAQALAKLRHPHICRIYDVGRTDEVEYFVMELIEGVTLSRRLEKGSLPLAEALAIGRAVASALAEAHRLGIVHRDVKPANILLTRNGPSLVDFGIAGVAADATGTPAGTPPYMAPEQARGVSDPRSDVFSAGAVLREMAGDDAPEALRGVIEACLQPDPEDRWQSASDLVRALEWLTKPLAAAPHLPWWRRAWAGYAVACVLAISALIWVGASRPKPRTKVLVPLRTPQNIPINTPQRLAVSPDGARIAFIAPGEGGEPLIWIRRLDHLTGDAVPSSVGASMVFWSPDGGSVGLYRNGQLQTIQLATGKLDTLAKVPGRPLRGIWAPDNHIVYACDNINGDALIYRLAASGGTLEKVTALDSAQEELNHGFPALLPDGEHFLFVAGSNQMTRTADDPGQTYLSSFKQISSRKLMLRGAFPVGAVGDRVYYVRENTLWSRRLDGSKGEWITEARVEITGVSWAQVTPQGAITYLPAAPKDRPAWVDRRGRKLFDVPIPEGEIIGVGVAPDGTAFVTRKEEQSAGIGLWIVRGQDAQRIGTGPGRYIVPAWSADGKWIFFGTGDGTGLHRRLPVEGAEEELLVSRGSKDRVITTTTRDGRYAFGVSKDSSGDRAFDIFRYDLLTQRLDDWSATARSETLPALSPDDRWIAWVCGDPRGRLCLSPRDDARAVSYITEIPAYEPNWSRDGRQLYFTSLGVLYSMPVSFSGGKVVTGTPERLFALAEMHRLGQRYAVENENRFLVRQTFRPPPDPVLVWE